MPNADTPEEKPQYKITIVGVEDFPESSNAATVTVITQGAGVKQSFGLAKIRADEMRAHVGKPLSREAFAKLWLPEKPQQAVIDLLDDLYGQQ